MSVSPEHTTWDTTPFPVPNTADPKFFALCCYSYSMCSGLKHVKFSSDIGSKCTNHYNTILCTYICPWNGIIQDWPQECNYYQCNIHTTIFTKIRQSCSNSMYSSRCDGCRSGVYRLWYSLWKQVVGNNISNWQCFLKSCVHVNMQCPHSLNDKGN